MSRALTVFMTAEKKHYLPGCDAGGRDYHVVFRPAVTAFDAVLMDKGFAHCRHELGDDADLTRDSHYPDRPYRCRRGFRQS